MEGSEVGVDISVEDIDVTPRDGGKEEGSLSTGLSCEDMVEGEVFRRRRDAIECGEVEEGDLGISYGKGGGIGGILENLDEWWEGGVFLRWSDGGVVAFH